MEHKAYILTKLRASFSDNLSQSLTSILFEDIPEIETFSKLKIDKLINRIVEGEPIQYVTAIAPFYGYFFNVNKHVLIPRPETEELVYHIEKYIKKEGMESCKIIDIGTGSGIIPITLAKLFPNAEIYGLDVSEGALNLARQNNLKLETNVTFLELDILNEDNWSDLKEFDIIVSNPPYIPEQEKELMEENVLNYEPHLALFVEDSDALIFYKKIHSLAKLNDKIVAVFLECNEFNAHDVGQIFSQSFAIEVLHDLQGKDRMIKALKESSK